MISRLDNKIEITARLGDTGSKKKLAVLNSIYPKIGHPEDIYGFFRRENVQQISDWQFPDSMQKRGNLHINIYRIF